MLTKLINNRQRLYNKIERLEAIRGHIVPESDKILSKNIQLACRQVIANERALIRLQIEMGLIYPNHPLSGPIWA